MNASPLSDHHAEADLVARHGLSDAVRKVDRAVARLEELQCLVRARHSGNACSKQNTPRCREKLALHARDIPRVIPNRDTANGAQRGCPHRPINSTNLYVGPHQTQRARDSRSSIPISPSRRSARVAALPPPPSSHRKLQASSHAGDASRGLTPPCTIPSPPPDTSKSSPLSSACSSSVRVVTRRAPLVKEAVSSKLPRTFVVDAGPANPNRPWCLSASPSPATTCSTSSNYAYTPSSNSSSTALPMKSPSRFSPLYRQRSRSRKEHEVVQSQPLLCKTPESLVVCSPIKPIKGSPKCPGRIPWFSQRRVSLPIHNVSASNTKKAPRRFSLSSNAYQDSPPRPLPALITRLPMRRKNALSPDENGAASVRRRSSMALKSSPNASPQKGQFKAPIPSLQQGAQLKPESPSIPPLPLPPALQGQVAVAIVGASQTIPSSCKSKVMHKRSRSCPRQCLVPLTEDSPNSMNPVVAASLQRPTKKIPKGSCFNGSGKENCFPGCSPAAWPCLRRSWSFSQQPCMENLTGAGPYIMRQVKGYMQHGKNMDAHVYKVDSIEQESDAVGSKLYRV